jgi:N-acetylglutamate synthase-like GNAT family acetyltransferase
MAKVMIRNAIMEDGETFVQLIQQLGYSATGLEMQRRLERIRVNPEQQQILVALQADQVIGLIHLQRRLSLISDCSVEIVSLVVAETFRSQGVGKELLDAAEEWARGQNITAIMLYSNCKRELAHRFYYRNGYGKIKDSIMLQKELASK